MVVSPTSRSIRAMERLILLPLKSICISPIPPLISASSKFALPRLRSFTFPTLMSTSNSFIAIRLGSSKSTVTFPAQFLSSKFLIFIPPSVKSISPAFILEFRSILTLFGSSTRIRALNEFSPCSFFQKDQFLNLSSTSRRLRFLLNLTSPLHFSLVYSMETRHSCPWSPRTISTCPPSMSRFTSKDLPRTLNVSSYLTILC